MMERIVLENSRLLVHLAYHYTGAVSDAEDIAQEAFVRLFTRAGKLNKQDSQAVKAWLARVTVNLSKDFLRSGWRRKRVALSEQEGAVTPPEESLLDTVRTLPPPYRAVIYLHYYEGYTLREIAGLLGRPEKTIHTWHARAKKRLKEALEGADAGKGRKT